LKAVLTGIDELFLSQIAAVAAIAPNHASKRSRIP